MKKITKKEEPKTFTPSAEPAPELSKKDQQQIKVIERVIESREIAPQDAFGKLTRPQVELIKRTVARGATDDELRLFIQVCKGAQLNPFLRQVHLVKRWDSKEGREVGAIQVGIDGFRAVAESSGQYAGNDDPIYGEEKEIEYTRDKAIKKMMAPTKATVTVYKLMEGQRMAFTATARWEEYYPGPKIGFQWHIRPYLMLGKCSEALALRKAFPKLLSGMYAAEEMDKGASTVSEEKKVATGFETLKNAMSTATLKELNEWKSKMSKSDKYTEKQKEEFFELYDIRVSELKGPVETIQVE